MYLKISTLPGHWMDGGGVKLRKMEKTMVIWKYPFDIDDEVSIKIPQEHKILSVQSQGGKLTAWAMVDPQSPKIDKTLYVYGTGHPINPEGKTFISTVQLNGLVWHFFE